MKNFDAALLRLKGQIGVTEDQAVASLLGLSKASFSDRKRRDAFPEDKLRALAHQRRDLNIDVDYVITGVAQAAIEMIRAAQQGRPMQKVSTDERALLSDYRACSAVDRHAIRRHAAVLAASGDSATIAADGRYPQKEEVRPMSLHEKSGKSGV
jgi:hypothetical protein